MAIDAQRKAEVNAKKLLESKMIPIESGLTKARLFYHFSLSFFQMTIKGLHLTPYNASRFRERRVSNETQRNRVASDPLRRDIIELSYQNGKTDFFRSVYEKSRTVKSNRRREIETGQEEMK